MRDALDGFVAGGGNAAIFSGNTCFWQVRFDDDHRAMTCFKYRADDDPVVGTADERFLTGPWSDRRIGRPETSTIGLTFTRGGYSRYGLGVPRASGGYTVWRPEHWAFEGTDLRYGDALGIADTIVAYEVDGVRAHDGRRRPARADARRRRARHAGGARDGAGAPVAAGRAAEPLRARAGRARERRRRRSSARDGPAQVHRLTNNHAVFGAFDVPGGGTVFNAGVTDWAYGIEGDDPDVVAITRNVLDRLSS